MSETLLIVEDEVSLLEVLRLVLMESGYDVLTATDGNEGVDVYTKHRDDIALVLTDMGLPTMGGWEMFQKIRQVNPNAKVILASGFFERGLREEFLQAGAVEFVQKPYIPEVILKLIRETIDAPAVK